MSNLMTDTAKEDIKKIWNTFSCYKKQIFQMQGPSPFWLSGFMNSTLSSDSPFSSQGRFGYLYLNAILHYKQDS